MKMEHLALVSDVMKLTTMIIQSHIVAQNELVELFQRASNEGRDLTDEEVARFRAKAEEVVSSMGDVNPLIDEG